MPGCFLKVALRVFGSRLVQLFNSCHRSRWVPRLWKRARMVLVPKKGKPTDTPSAYQPMYLLDEVGKLSERVVVSRVERALSRDGCGLYDCQYGFRGGRSTIDAIDRVRSLAEAAVSRFGVSLAVILGIANAFNALAWGLSEWRSASTEWRHTGELC